MSPDSAARLFLEGRAQRFGCGLGEGDSRGLYPARLDAQYPVELSRGVELLDGVAAADELSPDIELGNRGPGGVGLDALAQRLVPQHVGRAVVGDQVVEDANDGTGEATPGGSAAALHEEQDVVRLDERVDAVVGDVVGTHGASFWA
jgi:hypothetical protein